jgi:signal transduction histidine kinase
VLFLRLSGHWPVLLLAALTISAAGMVVWLISVIIGQEQAATEMRLLEAANLRVEELRGQIERFWKDKEDALEGISSLPAPEVFSLVYQRGIADSLLLRSSRGDMIYPTLRLPRRMVAGQLEIPLDAALSAEEATQKYASDAALAEAQGDLHKAAEAWFNVLRTALKAGDREAALSVAEGFFSYTERRAQVDVHGQCIGPVADAMLLEALKQKSVAVPSWLLERMRADLMDYVNMPMLARQRLTLMEGFRQNMPDATELPNMRAEELALELLKAEESQQSLLSAHDSAKDSKALPPVGGQGLAESAVPRLLIYQARRGTYLLLLEREAVLRELNELITPLQSLGRKARLVAPGVSETEVAEADNVVIEVGNSMPGWSLRMKASKELGGIDRVRRYGLAGVGCVLLLGVLTFLAARVIQRHLQKAQLQHELAATVSHELKTPLASMRLLVESLLEDKVLDAEKAREYLGLMGQENRRLSRLVENFLTLAKLERKGAKVGLVPVSPSWVAEAVTRSYGEGLAQNRLQLELSKEVPNVLADPDLLVVAVGNLVDNAHKYSQPPSAVHLRVRREGKWVLFEVRDHGAGMTQAEQERIWQPFERLEQHQHSVHGCGLGLAIVRRIVDSARGKLTVKSEQGQGSCFSVVLPACADDEEE